MIFTLHVIHKGLSMWGLGGWQISRKKWYEGVLYNIIRITLGWNGVKFAGKNCYVTLEWPLGSKWSRNYRANTSEEHTWRHDRGLQIHTQHLQNRTRATTARTNATTRGHSHKLKKERCNTRTQANFFRHRITSRWNNLCDDVVTAPNLNSFKPRFHHQWCAYKYLKKKFPHKRQTGTERLTGEQPTKAKEHNYRCMYI